MEPIEMMQRLWEAVLDITGILHKQLMISMQNPDPICRKLALRKYLKMKYGSSV